MTTSQSTASSRGGSGGGGAYRLSLVTSDKDVRGME